MYSTTEFVELFTSLNAPYSPKNGSKSSVHDPKFARPSIYLNPEDTVNVYSQQAMAGELCTEWTMLGPTWPELGRTRVTNTHG